jgi:hypothetical protein
MNVFVLLVLVTTTLSGCVGNVNGHKVLMDPLSAGLTQMTTQMDAYRTSLNNNSAGQQVQQVVQEESIQSKMNKIASSDPTAFEACKNEHDSSFLGNPKYAQHCIDTYNVPQSQVSALEWADQVLWASVHKETKLSKQIIAKLTKQAEQEAAQQKRDYAEFQGAVNAEHNCSSYTGQVHEMCVYRAREQYRAQHGGR